MFFGSIIFQLVSIQLFLYYSFRCRFSADFDESYYRLNSLMRHPVRAFLCSLWTRNVYFTVKFGLISGAQIKTQLQWTEASTGTAGMWLMPVLPGMIKTSHRIRSGIHVQIAPLPVNLNVSFAAHQKEWFIFLIFKANRLRFTYLIYCHEYKKWHFIDRHTAWRM